MKSFEENQQDHFQKIWHEMEIIHPTFERNCKSNVIQNHYQDYKAVILLPHCEEFILLAVWAPTAPPARPSGASNC